MWIYTRSKKNHPPSTERKLARTWPAMDRQFFLARSANVLYSASVSRADTNSLLVDFLGRDFETVSSLVIGGVLVIVLRTTACRGEPQQV